MPHWTDKLVKMRACREAVAWAKGYETADAAWAACERPDWMLWVAGKLATGKADKQTIVQAAAACARTALKFVPSGEARPLAAIKAAERWAENPSEKGKLAAAAAANLAADYAANADNQAAHAAAYAAFAAIHYDVLTVAALAVNVTIYAISETVHAATARTSANAARTSANKEMAEIIKGVVSIEILNGWLSRTCPGHPKILWWWWTQKRCGKIGHSTNDQGG